ncbi:MAG: redoxin domain-containing protein [Bacteroidia bacterium]
MKRLNWLVLLMILIVPVFFFQCNMDETVAEKNASDPDFDTLPELKLVTLAGDTITHQDFATDQRLVFVFVSPDCDHCRKEMESFPKEVAKLENAQVLVVSPYGREEVSNFAVEFGLDKHPKIMVLLDPLHEFDSKFLPDQTPILYLFDENREFVGVVRNKRNAKTINTAFEDHSSGSIF